MMSVHEVASEVVATT